jgi:hypothetical protein
MSMTTRPPGDVSRTTPATPVAPVTSATSPASAATAAAAAPAATVTAPRPPAIDAAGALRVFIEEVRASAQTQLVQAARPASLPPLADADPGNAAAALLRWLRAAVAEAPVPASALRDVVETAYARAAETLQRAAISAPPAARTDAATPQDVIASAREALASARDLVLRGLGGGARATAQGSPTETEAAPGRGVRSPDARTTARPDATRATSSGTERATTATRAEGTSLPASASARTAAFPATAGAAAAGSPIASAIPNTGSAPAVATVATARVPPIDPIATLRTFVDEIRTQLQATLGPSRMPAAPPPLVADPRGESLAPALLRWLTSAVAEKGVALAPLQDAVRTAFARVDASLAAASPSGATDPSTALAHVRDTLQQVRDQVLRGLGAAPDRDDRGAVRIDAPVPRGDVRADGGVVDPRGVPVPTGVPVARRETARERVEAVGAERRARTGRELEPVDEPPVEDDGARRDESDLQGPMDCVRRYFDAYLAGDSTAYAAQWVYPACVWSDGRWSAYLDECACAAGNDAYTARLRLQGIVGGRIVMLRVEPTSADAAVVHGVFTRERADGSVVSEVEAAYTTVRTDAGWRVAVCIVKPTAEPG